MPTRDNFDLIRRLLKFESPGDCYYLQLLRRASDDPHTNGLADPKYHGNMHSRSIKDYYISSLEHLDDVRDEITTLCDTFNVRAYIRLNKRTYKSISLAMLTHIAEQTASGESYSSPFHLLSSAAGKASAAGKDKTWILDIDAEYLDDMKAIMDMVELKCEPFDYTKIIARVPTKSGCHLISKPFNTAAFSKEWNSKWPGRKQIDIHKDNPTILYVP